MDCLKLQSVFESKENKSRGVYWLATIMKSQGRALKLLVLFLEVSKLFQNRLRNVTADIITPLLLN